MRLIARAQRVVVLAAIVLLAACSAPAPSASLLPPGEFALPTEAPIELPSGAVEACGGIAIEARLHGDPADPHLAWLVDNSGLRREVVWPPGYRARFSPSLEVLAPTGVAVLREDDPVSAACVTGDPGILLLEPPFTE